MKVPLLLLFSPKTGDHPFGQWINVPGGLDHRFPVNVTETGQFVGFVQFVCITDPLVYYTQPSLSIMHEASVTREIRADKEVVWEGIDDFGGIDKYSPPLEQSEIIGDQETGEGAIRECYFEDGTRVEEEIVEYEPGSSYTIEIVDLGGLPMKESYTTMSVEAVDDARTEVTWTSRFTPKYGPLGWLMAKLLMKSKIREQFADSLEGLDEYVTEEQATQQGNRAETGPD